MEFENRSKSSEQIGGSVERAGGNTEGMAAGGVFTVECLDKDGNIKWVDICPNLVVNTGLQDMNTKYFTGSGYTSAWYIGLVNDAAANVTYSSGDTLASHAGWNENTQYSGNRKAASFGSATLADPSNINNSSSAASFTMNATAVIAGAFLAHVATGNVGLLFSVSNFQAPGDRSVVSGDVLNVTYSFNLDAS
jgi:hypothetical protein